MQTNPVNYVADKLLALQWPVIVLAAFALGRYVCKLELRAIKAEKNLSDVVERHLPHVHSALSAVKESLAEITGMVRR